jgi:hypothetical protein
MNVQSAQILNQGISSLARGMEAREEKKLREAMLKRQIARDAKDDEGRAFDRDMRNKQIELAASADRRAGRKDMDENMRGAAADVQREIENLRKGQETAARVDLLKAQAGAVGQPKPQEPGPDQKRMMDWMNMRSAAMQRLQQAQKSGDPAAIAMAKEDYEFVQETRQNWLKQQKEPTVDLEFPGEDGVSKMTMKVPQSQWNEKHPMFNKFAGTVQPTTPAAQPPMTQQQVLDEVRSGKMTKEQAAAYGQKQGWN